MLPLLSLRCRSDVAPLSHRCRTAVTPLLHRCRTAIAMLSLCCRSAVTPLSLRCRSAAVAPTFDTQLLLLSPLLSLRCCSAVTPLSLCCRFCHSIAAAAVATLSLLLSPLMSLTVVASRGRIRVTVFIGNCQACVSSSSEGYSTLRKIVKVEAY